MDRVLGINYYSRNFGDLENTIGLEGLECARAFRDRARAQADKSTKNGENFGHVHVRVAVARNGTESKRMISYINVYYLFTNDIDATQWLGFSR